MKLAARMLPHRWVSWFFHQKQGFIVVFGLLCGLMLNLLLTPMGSTTSCGGGVMKRMVGKMVESFFHHDTTDSVKYEPRIVVRDPEEIAQKEATSKPVIRQKFYADELDVKKKLLVAVMSRSSVLESYGAVMNSTLRHHVDKVLFFMQGPLTKLIRNMKLPVVSFDREKKNKNLMFQVVKYLDSTYHSEYSYFLIVDAHESMPYVNGRAVHRDLSHISVSHPLHYGIPTSAGSHHCSLSKGVILSNNLLNSTAANLDWCINHTFDRINRDTSFGRCVLHATALPCSSTIQEKSFRSFDLQLESVEMYDAIKEKLESLPSPPYSVTGIRHEVEFFTVHQVMIVKEIELLKKSLEITREVVRDARSRIPLSAKDETWPLGSPSPHSPKTRFDVLPWTAFNSTHVFMPDEHTNVGVLTGDLLNDITSVVLAGASHISNTTNGQYVLQRLNYGYYKVDPVRGTDYILSLLFRDSNTGLNIVKIIEGSRNVANVEFIPMPYVTERNPLIFIVPFVSSDIEIARTFLTNFIKTENLRNNCDLIFVMSVIDAKRPTSYKSFKSECDAAASEFEMNVKLLTISDQAKRQEHISHISMLDQIVRNIDINSLIAILPPYANVTSVAADRFRINTIRGWQIFSPMVWAMYHPKLVSNTESYKNMDVMGSVGYFQRHDFSVISFYMSDYKMARNLASNTFPIVNQNGKNNISRPPLSVYRLFLSFSNLHVIRAPEPYIRMPFKQFECPFQKIKIVDSSSNSLHSDLSLLMGSSTADVNTAYYRYIMTNHVLHHGTSNVSDASYKTSDFIDHEFCEEKLLNSFGTRIQLNKAVLEYENKLFGT